MDFPHHETDDDSPPWEGATYHKPTLQRQAQCMHRQGFAPKVIAQLLSAWGWTSRRGTPLATHHIYRLLK
jgi:hypothetical protein